MGGQKSLEQVRRLLRLLDNKILFLSRSIWKSREVKEPPRKKILTYPRYIKELGVATLDVRNIFSLSTPTPERPHLIVTQQYSTEHASEDFEDCDFTDLQECVFAKTVRIRQVDIVPTIEHCLKVPDSDATPTVSGSGQLRPVLMVGHSIKHGLNVLQRLGLDITFGYPVTGFSTHTH